MSGFFEYLFGAGGAIGGGVVGGIGGGAAGGLVDGAIGAGAGTLVAPGPGTIAGGIGGAGYGAATGAFLGAGAGGYYGYTRASQAGAALDNAISDWWNADKAADQAQMAAVPATTTPAGSQSQAQTGATTATCATGNCPPSPDCRNIVEKMRGKIEGYIKELRKYDPVSDAAGGHQYMLNGVLRTTVPGGHYKEIRALQRGLKNELTSYNQKKCYDNATEGDKAVRNQAQRISSQNVEVPPGIPFEPL
ncbi:hypothetical protein MAUB1S_06382 [Mycolicibacterium aubagnense]